jgi:hypothetical protein
MIDWISVKDQEAPKDGRFILVTSGWKWYPNKSVIKASRFVEERTIYGWKFRGGVALVRWMSPEEQKNDILRKNKEGLWVDGGYYPGPQNFDFWAEVNNPFDDGSGLTGNYIPGPAEDFLDK